MTFARKAESAQGNLMPRSCRRQEGGSRGINTLASLSSLPLVDCGSPWIKPDWKPVGG